MNERIVIDPELQHGKPVIRGTRVRIRLRPALREDEVLSARAL